MGKSKLFGGGTAMGRYVWRKSAIIPANIVTYTNPAFKITALNNYSDGVANQYCNATIQCLNFNANYISRYAKGLAGFFLDFSCPDWDTCYIYDYGNSYNAIYYKMYSDSRGGFIEINNMTIDSDSQMTWRLEYSVTGWDSLLLNKIFTLPGSRQIILSNEQHNPICFVCSNKAEQYPSNGVYNGYWYELIGTIESTNALSLSNLSADTMRNISVEEIQKGVTDGIL